MSTDSDRYAADWLAKAQLARTCNDRREPWPAWSMSESLAVAVILHDGERLIDLDYTEIEALDRFRNDIGLPTLNAAAQWFEDLRARL